jgi:EpsI family protein
MRYKTFIVSLICILITFVFILRSQTGANVDVIRKNLEKLPIYIGSYRGFDLPMEGSIIRELDTDVYIFRGYTEANGSRIVVYVGYYGTKKGGRTGHNPDACYPASGWSIINASTEIIPVSFNGKGQNVTLNRLDVKMGERSELVYHWYQSDRDMVLQSGIDQNLHRLKSRLLHNRNDGAFVRVSAPIQNSTEETRQKLIAFIQHLYPLLAQYWPVEMEK